MSLDAIQKTKAIGNLEDKLIIATPLGDKDPCFARSVVYVHDHSKEGAVGLIINKPSPVTMGELSDSLELKDETELQLDDDTPVLLGGPVAPDRGFFIHFSASNEPKMKFAEFMQGASSSKTAKNQDWTTEFGSPKPQFFLGFSGWDKGQLEEEFLHDQWLVVPLENTRAIFEVPVEKRYQFAASLLGVDLACYSPEVGHV